MIVMKYLEKYLIVICICFVLEKIYKWYVILYVYI